MFKDSPTADEATFSAGGPLGVSVALGKWIVLPELAAVYPISTGIGGPQAAVGQARGPTFQFAVGVAIGL